MKELFYRGRDIYYRINEFRPEHQTLVFIHGFSGSSSAWLEYEKKFEKTYNILTFDLRGHGKSAKPHEYKDYAVENFTEDLHGLCAHLQIQRSILISHSYGTLVGLDFLIKYQDKITSVVFLSPVFGIERRVLAKAIKPLLAGVGILGFFPFSERPGGHIDYTQYRNSGDWNIPRMFADIRNTSLRIYLYCARQFYAFDTESLSSRIEVATLIVHGKNDTISPVENSLRLAKEIRNSKVVLLDNTDHIIVLNNFTEVSTAIENFIEEVRPRAKSNNSSPGTR